MLIILLPLLLLLVAFTSLADPLVLGLKPAPPVVQVQTPIVCDPGHSLWAASPPNLVSFPLTLEQMVGALLSLCERD